MTITAAITAKIALFDFLTAEAESKRFGDLVVSHSWPGEVAAERLLYGGGATFVQEPEVAEQGVLIRETIRIGLYIRVVRRPACDPQETDLAAHEVASLIGKVFVAQPDFAGPYTWLGIARGSCDYSRTADETISILALHATIGTRISWYDGM